MVRPSPSPLADAVRVGLRVPASFGRTAVDPSGIPGLGTALALSAVEIDAALLERQLGVPALPPALARMADEGFETGMLPLEEEILQDEIELAERTIAARRREWRRDVGLAPLEALRSTLLPVVDRVLVRWEHLADLADDEIGFAMRLAAAVGAGAVVTGFSQKGVQRLVRAAEAADLRIAFEPRSQRWDDDAAAAIHASQSVGLSLPIDGAMPAARIDALSRALEQCIARVAQVTVSSGAFHESSSAARPGAGAWTCCDLLRKLRAQETTLAVPVVVAVDWHTDQSSFVTAATAALADCRACLGT